MTKRAVTKRLHIDVWTLYKYFPSGDPFRLAVPPNCRKTSISAAPRSASPCGIKRASQFRTRRWSTVGPWRRPTSSVCPSDTRSIDSRGTELRDDRSVRLWSCGG